MRILFITASRIGDAVLSTGLLDHILYAHPQARVTVACGPLCASLFAGYPALERIIPLQKRRFHGHWLDLWRETVGTRWDMVIDLRNSAVSRLIPAGRRHVYGPHIDKTLHKVEQNAAVMGLSPAPSPRLWPTRAQQVEAGQMIPLGSPVIAVGPAANWRAKTWPAERFIEIVRWMRGPEGPMPGARVAVFAAPGEEEAARPVLESVPAQARIDAIARLDPGTAAAALARCNFYMGNDSGLMHCAAASGIATLGLFGPSWPHLYRPWGPHAAFVSTPLDFAALTGYEGYRPQTAPCLMEGLSVDAVKTAVLQILSR